MIRTNRYRVRAANINGETGPWSTVGRLPDTVIENLRVQSPEGDTIWVRLNVFRNPDGRKLYFRARLEGTETVVGGVQEIRINRPGGKRAVLDGLAPSTHYRVDIDCTDSFDSDGLMTRTVWTVAQGHTPLKSPYARDVMESQVHVGGSWQDAADKDLTISMGGTGKYRIRMKACSGERTVYPRRIEGPDGQLGTVTTDVQPFSSNLGCDEDAPGEWQEMTVTAQSLYGYTLANRVEALLRAPFRVVYNHEVWRQVTDSQSTL